MGTAIKSAGVILGAVALAAICATIAQAQTPAAQLEGNVAANLRTALEAAVGVVDTAPRNRLEARRRAMRAAEDVVTVLRSEGYYAHEVDAEVRGVDPPTPVVSVDPGPRFAIADPEIEWTAPPPPPDVRQAAREALQLRPGEPGQAAAVVAAEGRIVARVEQQGFADVRAAPRQVVVNHADRTVRPLFRIEAGELVRLNGVELATDGRTGRGWVDRLAPWRAGQPYDPENVAELERRLLDTGVYETVTVALTSPEKTTPAGLRPVVVSLTEREPHTLELGARYSTSEGGGLEARWTRYNGLGRADTLRLLGRLSQVDSRLGGGLALPHWRRADQTLRIRAEAYRSDTDAFDEAGAGLRADVTRRYGRTSYLTVGGALDYGSIDEPRADPATARRRDLLTASALALLALDRSDDPLDPAGGWRLRARAEPTAITGDGSLAFVKLEVQGSAYVPFSSARRTVGAGRLRLGAIAGGTVSGVPAPRRFYAGGGGSVRGYPYQAVGPRLPNGAPQGGLSLVEASVEVRHRLAGPWGVAAFVDAGSVGRGALPTFDDLSAGAGLGVRYDLGFGPIRADIAVPLNKHQGDPSFQVYLSIGQSF